MAIFIAKEFNLAMKKTRRIFKQVVYVTVELVHIPSRPSEKAYLSLEPYIIGEYKKFNNNNGYVDKTEEIYHSILQTFSHFSFCYSGGLLMVTDVQGCVYEDKYLLTDPAIHTADRKKQFPDRTNLGLEGISAFFATHVCNEFCRVLSLTLPGDLDISISFVSSRDKIIEESEEDKEDDENIWSADS